MHFSHFRKNIFNIKICANKTILSYQTLIEHLKVLNSAIYVTKVISFDAQVNHVN